MEKTNSGPKLAAKAEGKKAQAAVRSKKSSRELKKLAKKNIRTMQRSRAHHPLREQSRIFKYGFSSFGRNFWLSCASIAVMVITLIILFATIVASIILNNTAEDMRDKIDITIYLKPETSEETLQKLSNILKQNDNVKSIETSTSAEEYKKFIQENSDSEDILSVLDDAEMQSLMVSKMQATMRLKVYDTNRIDSIKETVDKNELFQEYLDPNEEPTYDVNRLEISKISSWSNMARTGGVALALIFLVVSVLIIFSTIRMAIFSRREEIYMMRLVGADKRFIRGPFLVEAELCGIIAGLIAASASYGLFVLAAPRLENYGISISNVKAVLESNQLLLVYLAFVVIGALIGRISARFAIQKYLRKVK